MRKQLICLVAVLFFCTEGFCEIDSGKAQFFGADDLHLGGGTMTSFQVSNGEHILVFNDGFDFVLGDNKLKSKEAVVWINSVVAEHRGSTNVDHKVTVYLQGKVTVSSGAGSKTSGLAISKPMVEGAESMVANFVVLGEIFATAKERIEEDPRTSQVYQNALLATGQIKPPAPPAEGKTVAAQEQQQGQLQEQQQPEQLQPGQQAQQQQPQGPKPGIFKRTFGKDKTTGQQKSSAKQAVPATPAVPLAPAPKFQYPVNISSATEEPIKITNENLTDGTSIATVMNRFYLWQKQDELGRLLEFQSDCAVIFYTRKTNEPNKSSDILPSDNMVKAIYFRGNIVMTESNRTIRADEVYYDFQKKQALVINANMRTFDPMRGIPIYVRADKLKQVAENKFAGNNVTVTSSEFYIPKISMTASEVYIADSTAVDQEAGKLDNHSYDVMAKNVKIKTDNRTVFWWPYLRTNLERSDMPLKSVQVSRDKTFGTSVESEWYLARVLGLREPPGVKSSLLMVDSYSKRGTGVGADISYQKDKYFGNINGYIIDDHGKDDLSRDRQGLVPPNSLRGMFNFQHRQFLPNHWQLTLETSYMSDENYLESFHRDKYFSGRGQETSAQLKWLNDNQAFAVLGRFRINNFADQLEDLPSAQYHLTGQSLFNDKFTLYSDNMAGRFRQRTGKDHDLTLPNEYFTFGSTRNELDMPLKFKTGNIVPYVAGTFGYDDRTGFDRATAIGSGTQFGEKEVFIGEAGVRASTQYWKNYNVRSKFWDINGIRHIVKPYVNAAVFSESTDLVKQRNNYTLGVLQRWQTKRGQGEKERILDWMRLNLEYTKVSDPSNLRRADRPLWNNPFTPLSTIAMPSVFNSDLGSTYRTFGLYGPQRDSINADYLWRLSDTTAILSDLNYDVQDNKIEQFNIGLSRLVWPNLSYYIGTRYMRSIEIDGDKGSNALTFAATYKISQRYTLTFAEQYDFKRDGRILTQVSLIRRYHRLYYGITYSIDETLDRRTIMFTIWPEGIGEMGMGKSRSLMGVDAPTDRNY
ncbi:MAG: LPS assembly protein LptD [Sedimentisphaerales bacterium]